MRLSGPWRAGAFGCAMLLALCAPAGAKVLLLSPDASVVGLPVRDPYSELVGWTDDGTALLMRRDDHALRLDLATGADAPQPLLDDAASIGPGGRAIVPRYGPGGPSLELREADGRVVAVQAVAPSLSPPSAAWSRDGTRVAVAVPPSLIVLDTTSGAPVLRTTLVHPELSSQAFAPDGSALLVADGARVLRIDLPSGNRSVVLHAPEAGIGVAAAWGPGGQVALVHDDRIRISGSPEVRVPAFSIDSASWTGTAAR
ncbi:MAG: hypothetical protein ACXVSX_19335 [Solirubrobacteraceae bacterium]